MLLPFIQKIKSWYFNLRPFETRDGGVIYQKLGVGIYKKYLPTSGDLISRARGIKRLKTQELGRRAGLENHKTQTYKWEWRHLISAVLLQSWAIFGGLKFGAEQFWISSVINIVVNVYPIMLQRFNRARINQCLKKN